MANNEGMEGVEDPLKEIEAEEIITASLESGFLTDICDVSVTMHDPLILMRSW